MLLAGIISSPLSAQEDLYLNSAMNIGENVAFYVGNDLELSSNASLEVEPGATLLIENDLTNNAANNAFKLKASSNSAYAQMQLKGAYSGSGALEHQMYFAGGWQMVAASMNATSASYFGNVGSTGPGHTAITQNLFSWNGSDYVNVLDNNATINPGVGYFGYVGTYGFRANSGVQIFSGTPNTSLSAPSLRNDIASGTISVQGGLGNQGWNLVANPFTCALDFSQLTKSNLNNAFHVYDPNKSGGAGYEASSGAGISGTVIAPMQSFWVRASGNSPSLGSLSMATHCNLEESPKLFKNTPNFDRLVLRTAPLADSSIQDYTVVAFIAQTSKGHDSQWDALKLANTGDIPNIYSHESDALAINAIDFGPNYPQTDSLAIAYQAPHHGQVYEISFDKSYMIYPYEVVLEDKKLGSFTDLNQNTYQFPYDSNYVDRFMLHFSSKTVGLDHLANHSAKQVQVWMHQGTIHYLANYKGQAQLSLLDLSGRQLWHTALDFSKDQAASIPLGITLPSGIYLLRSAEANGSVHIQKVFFK